MSSRVEFIPAKAALVQDLVGVGNIYQGDASGAATEEYWELSVAGSGEAIISSTTKTFSALSMAVGVGMANIRPEFASHLKLRLYMGGVQVAEGGYYTNTTYARMDQLVATRALVGSQIIKITMYNYDVGITHLYSLVWDSIWEGIAAGVAVGSVKI